ncbi:MAG TPA: hypothetical protein VLV78_19375 [Thermoanaerobaculia bacterium]|nr:hypothetical protein [Thermoanaerobaculia bacterium]
MKKFLVLVLLVAWPAMAGISVRRSPYSPRKVDVYIVGERLTDAIGALEIYLPKRVEMVLGDDPVVTYRAKEVSPAAALKALVAAAKVEMTEEEERFRIRSPGEPTVTIDFKDGEVQEILKSMQRQCGIKNLMIDPQVQGKGTFMLTEVPCRQAFDVVLRTLGLAAQTYSNNIVRVEVSKP